MNHTSDQSVLIWALFGSTGSTLLTIADQTSQLGPSLGMSE